MNICSSVEDLKTCIAESNSDILQEICEFMGSAPKVRRELCPGMTHFEYDYCRVARREFTLKTDEFHLSSEEISGKCVDHFKIMVDHIPYFGIYILKNFGHGIFSADCQGNGLFGWGDHITLKTDRDYNTDYPYMVYFSCGRGNQLGHYLVKRKKNYITKKGNFSLKMWLEADNMLECPN